MLMEGLKTINNRPSPCEECKVKGDWRFWDEYTGFLILSIIKELHSQQSYFNKNRVIGE
jgi:hypothetical protein